MTEQRLKELFKQYYDKLLYFGLKMIRGRQEVEDIIVKSMMKLWDGRIRDNEQTGNILHTFMKQRCLDVIKHNKRANNHHQIIFNSATEDSASLSSNPELSEKIKYCIGQMSPQPKKVMTLLLYDDLDMFEIADKLKISVDTVRVQKARAVKELKHYLRTGTLISKTRLRPHVIQKLITAIDNGINCEVICNKLNISRTTYERYKTRLS